MTAVDEPITMFAGFAPGTRFWDGVARSYLPPAVLDVDASLRLHTTAADDVDPITTEVVRYTLLNANVEHSALLQRLCVSPIVMITRDFQASILTEDGDLAFMGPNLQYFANASSLIVKWILEHRSASPGIAPGDMWLCNDPYVGAPHQPDTCVAAPVFAGEELFCWVANILHHTDVGGSMAGSFCLDATDAWAEPPSFPPVKLMERGRVRSDVEQLFLRQSRMPVNVAMDLRASIAANDLTRRKLEALVGRYGADVVKAVMRRTLDAGEALVAERLRAVPDGRWSHRAYTEAAVPGDRGVYRYQLNVTKRGEELIVDNDGTDAQTGAINLTFGAFAGAVLAAVTAMLTPELAGAYGGVYRRVRFELTPGLLNCAEYPAAVSPSGAFQTEMVINTAALAIGKMLTCAEEPVRSLALGPNIPHFYGGCLYAGLDGDGKLFFHGNTDAMMGSIGAMPGRDGIDVGGHFWIPEGIASNIEQVEQQFPSLYLYRRLLPAGHDGAGRTRGGRGFEEAAVMHGATVGQIPVYLNESFTKGQGQWGGNPGTLARFRLRTGARVEERFGAGEVPQDLDALPGTEPAAPWKGPAFPPLGVGDAWHWCSPSTAGWGDPLERDPDAVASDVRDGACSAAVAAEAWGVVLDARGEVDAGATAARRHALLAGRLGHPPARAGWPGEPPAGRRVGDRLVHHEGRWWCVCGTDLAPADDDYKTGAVVRTLPIDGFAPGFETGDPEMAAKMELREVLCPGCGHRLDTEIARVGDPLLHDVRLDG